MSEKTLEAVVLNHVESSLNILKYNKTVTASKLGITRQTLLKKIRVLDKKRASCSFLPIKTIEEIETEHILSVLHENHGNRSKTAEVLNICTRTLRHRLSAAELKGYIITPASPRSK